MFRHYVAAATQPPAPQAKAGALFAANEQSAGRRAVRRGALSGRAALLLASGAAGLMFQIIWIRQLSLIFGTDLQAVTLAVAGFFAGLGLGGLIWGSIAARAKFPWRLYACLELGAAALGLLTTLLLAHASAFFVRIEMLGAPLAWGLALLAIAVPACLMGGTLPALLACDAPAARNAGEAGGLLYAANTAGAVIGTLLPPFLLIPALGLQGTAFSAAALGAAAGLIAWAARGSARYRGQATARAAHVLPAANARKLLPLYAVAGAVALGYEVAWSQALLPFLSTRACAFSIMLAAYLTGLAIGAGLAARVRGEAGADRQAWSLFGLLIAAAGLAALGGVAMLGHWLVVAQSLAEARTLALGGSPLAGMCARFAVAAGVLVLPPTIALGAAFPVLLSVLAAGTTSPRRAANNNQTEGGLEAQPPAGPGQSPGLTFGATSPPQAAGTAVAANTLGGILGTALTGFVLIPWLGVLPALGALAACGAAVGIAALAWGGASRGTWAGMAAIVGALVVIIVSVPANRLAAAFPGAAGGALVFYQEGRGATVAVVEHGAGAHRFRRLYIQGVSNSGDAMPSLRYMRLQALLPLIIHNGTPRSALVIGYGTGITAGALLRAPFLQNRVVAELLPGVMQAAPLFHGTSGATRPGALDVRLRDGRHELLSSPQTYDLITLEPPPPAAAGVVNLYSSDFYRLAAARLNPKGLMAQWLPLTTQNEDDTRSLVRSFTNIFPYASLWTTELHEMLLVGSATPVKLDMARIRARFATGDIAAALAEVGIASPEALLATYVTGRAGLDNFTAGAPPVTDDRPRIEYASWARPAEFGSVLPDLLNLRDNVPVTGANDTDRASIAQRRVELLTFYHAGMLALAGNQSGWRNDMREVLAADPGNPYYQWFIAP